MNAIKLWCHFMECARKRYYFEHHCRRCIEKLHWERQALFAVAEKFAIYKRVLEMNLDQCNMELGDVGVHEAALRQQADEEGVSLENVSNGFYIGKGLFPHIGSFSLML